jgi:CRISPR-associated protein Cmr6
MSTEQLSAHSYREPLDPLYQFLSTNGEAERKKLHSGGKTNAGLWLDKYIKNQSQDDANSRSDLVREGTEIAIPAAYEQFYGRWKQTLAGAGVTPQQMRLAQVKGRMIIGLGDESVLETSIALHHTYGAPYIPGSALKGLAASYARQRLEKADWGKESAAYNVLFGDTNESGCITFFDALLDIGPNKKYKRGILFRDIITVHHPDYYQGGGAPPADWDSPTPLPLLSAAGDYLIALAAPNLANGALWIDKAFEILGDALKEMGIGAKTSSGYGRMTLQGN